MKHLGCVCLLASVVAYSDVVAEEAAPFRDFNAKRIGATTAPIGKRITVQIDPVEQAALLAPKPPVPVINGPAPSETPSELGRYSWFWDRVSPALTDAGPGRLDQAMDALAASDNKVMGPRLQHMQSIARANGVDILRSTVGTRVSPALVLAVIAVESAGKKDAVSVAGAQGLMQLMPATAERFGVSDSFAPTENIAGGVKYLDWLMGEFDGDPMMVLAGYNAGEGNVRSHAGVPPFAETRDYVPKVLAAFQLARGLCRTPPMFISDGCVFVSMN